METILVEEHYILTDVQEKVRDLVSKDPKGMPVETMLSALEKLNGFHGEDDLDQHKTRMKFMNDNHVRMQILSYGYEDPSSLTGDASIELCKLCNDVLGEYVDLRPTRFQGLAVLPINEPEAAAQELRRSVKELGLKGALVAGSGADGTFLNHPKYEGIFEAAAELDVPIYLHPASIKSEVYQSYYKSPTYADLTASAFASFGYGWHTETGIHAIRLVLSGLLDRYPNLQIILGHWGEFVPFFLERMDQSLLAEHLKQPISAYFKNNFYITPSGMLSKPQFEMIRHYFGIDRILYASDYPYTKPEGLSTFLDTLNLTTAEQAKIAYQNAERLFGIDTEQD